MFVDRCTYKTKKGKTHTRTLLRHGYREKGKIKMKTIANISSCTDEEIEAIKIALKSKADLPKLKALASSTAESGKYVGSLCLIAQMLQELGISKALGGTENAKRIQWLIAARLLEQGSRLSATRAAKQYAVGEIFGMKGFCEDDLYKALDWLYTEKDTVEQKLFRQKQTKTGKTPSLFLYDVSSSYLEGTQNELGAYGYNRDKKKGKQQIVYGVLTDEEGDPVSIKAFPGNTADTKTFADQIETLSQKFGCKTVTMVGDKGMIKADQIKDLKEADFHFITTITKPQIKKLLHEDTFQMELFQDKLCEIIDSQDGMRYICKRNPIRAKEIQNNREERIEYMRKKTEKTNTYLSEHPKAKPDIQKQKLEKELVSRKLKAFVSLNFDEETKCFSIAVNEEKKKEESKLDGCYAMKTDLPKEVASKETINVRYKDLAKVEWAFRTQKTGYLEIRSIYLRKKERTIAHLLVTMLAYKIEKRLREAWKKLDITVEEGLRALSRITTYQINIGNEKLIKIANPSDDLQEILDLTNTTIPSVLPYREINVITRKKITKQ